MTLESTTQEHRPFQPAPADAAGIVSWIHIGDLHLTERDAQNARELTAIVAEINRTFANRINFALLPGDVAEHGRPEEFAIARKALDTLETPWCAIVGDHDVQQRTFAPFLASMGQSVRYAFRVGAVEFLAMNAFDVADPGAFCVSADQLRWAEDALAAAAGRRAVVLLHCYPSDLKQGGEPLGDLIRRPEVLLVEMGHTHYNEVANDGATLYIATRSTGQIEEGPVGFSVTNMDGDAVSWRFIELASQIASHDPVVMITSPADERFLTDRSRAANASATEGVTVRAKVWSAGPATDFRVVAHLDDRRIDLSRITGGSVWQGVFEGKYLRDGVHALRVTLEADRTIAADEIRLLLGAAPAPVRAPRDQDNALPAWPERGLLATQLGPNKNGRKW